MQETKPLKIKLMFDHIVTTCNRRKVEVGKLIVQPDDILSKQTVLSAGSNAGVEVGEEIEINLNRLPRIQVQAKNDVGPDKTGAIIYPTEKILGREVMLLSSREIKYIYTK
jgi:hypothetical protein